MDFDANYELKQVLRRAREVHIDVAAHPGGLVLLGGERFQRAALVERLGRDQRAAEAERKTLVAIYGGAGKPRLAMLSTPLPAAKVAAGLSAGVRLAEWYDAPPSGNTTTMPLPVLRPAPGEHAK